MTTTFYIFNEKGIVPKEELEIFCSDFETATQMEFTVLCKEDIDLESTIFKKYVTPEIEYIIYDHGYVMKVEGRILDAMVLLQEIDRSINDSVSFHVSPSQRVVNEEENKYIRGAKLKEVASFLDKQFYNSDYTGAIVNTEEE